MAANPLPSPPLLVITDRLQARSPLEEIAEAAFAAGCRWLSLREKDVSAAERLRLLARLAGIGSRYNAVVGVHDDLAAASAVSGAALHLPADGDPAAARRALGPDRLIGLSAHGGDALAGPAVAGADYMTLSPMRPTGSKPGYGPALGATGVANAVARAALPVVALGGIVPVDIPAYLRAGAAGVAVMGGVMGAEHVGAAIRALLGQLCLAR